MGQKIVCSHLLVATSTSTDTKVSQISLIFEIFVILDSKIERENNLVLTKFVSNEAQNGLDKFEIFNLCSLLMEQIGMHLLLLVILGLKNDFSQFFFLIEFSFS